MIAKTKKTKKTPPARKRIKISRKIKSTTKRKIEKKAKKSIGVKKSKEKEIGKITHFYDKINVAVIKLSGSISLGDKIKIRGGDGDVEFEQKVDSMEFNHQKIKKAQNGDEIGLKVRQKVKEGYKVFKI